MGYSNNAMTHGAEKAHINRKQALTIKAGDMLDPIDIWNSTERFRKLTCPTEVIEVHHERGCQTGVLIKVKFTSGAEAYLDAAWFNAPTAISTPK